MASVPLRALEPESSVLGIPCVVVALDDVPVAELPELVAAARASGARCLVGELNPERSHAIVEVQHHGFQLAEATVVLVRRAGAPLPVPAGVLVRPATGADVEALADVVAGLARWTGHAEDPRVGEDGARRLVEVRLAAALEAGGGEGGGDRLVVAVDDGEPVGLAVLAAGSPPRIDLLGARRHAPDVADALLAAAVTWADAVGEDLATGPCAVADVTTLASFEQAGFVVSGSRYRYVRWLDEEGA